MSKLYSSVSSDSGKTESTKRGHKEINSHVRGWNLGIKVLASYCKETEKTKFLIYSTGGSTNPSEMKLLKTVSEK